MKHYIIDAHNVIHASDVLKAHIVSSYDIARNSLLQMIDSYSKVFPSYKFTAIFDGIIGYISISSPKIKIMSSGEREADELIKTKISKLKSTKNVIVVSSDLEVVGYARVNACEVISAKAFISLLNNPTQKKASTSKSKSSKSEKPNTPSKKEVEEFKKLFGE